MQWKLPRRRGTIFLLLLLLLLLTGFLLLMPEIVFNLVPQQTDIVLHYTWSSEFAKALHEGCLYPRWMPDEKLGLGDPAFVHYPPLYSALVALAAWTGIGIWNSMKLVDLAALWLAGVFAFRMLGRYLAPAWAFAGAVTLQASPFLMALLSNFNARPWFIATPVVMATLLYATDNKARGYVDVRLALIFALLVLAHVLTAFMVLLSVPFLALGYLEHRGAAIGIGVRIGLSFAIGTGLAGFYLIPALLDIPAISPENWERGVLDWHGAFVFPFITSHFFAVRWFAFQWIVPAAALAMTAALVLHAWHVRKERRSRSRRILGLAWVSSAALFLSTEFSYPLWHFSHALQRIQFPYRFTYLQMIAAVAGSFLCVGYGRVATRRLAAAMPVVAAIGLTPAMLARNLTAHMPAFASSRIASGIYGAPEYLPAHAGKRWAEYVARGGLRAECADRGANCRESLHATERRAWQIDTAKNVDLVMPVFFYPAWGLRIDGRNVPTRYDPATGLIRVSLGAGRHSVTLDWRHLPNGRRGTVASIVALLVLNLAQLASRLGRRRFAAPTAERPIPATL